MSGNAASLNPQAKQQVIEYIGKYLKEYPRRNDIACLHNRTNQFIEIYASNMFINIFPFEASELGHFKAPDRSSYFAIDVG